jgi:hypothetical protein
MTKLEYAQLFRMMGFSVIPLMHRNKLPASHMMGGTWEKYKTQLPTEYDVTNWFWSDWQNYGVVAGWNNLTIIDFDDAMTFDLWLNYFAMVNRDNAICASPFMVRTSRGAHVYITTPGVERVNKKLRGVDVKMNGYVVGPGSTHPSGAIYQALNHNFCFPEIYSLDTLLPADLFPPMAIIETVNPVIEMEFVYPPQATEYDPFAAASGASQGLDLITKVKQAVKIENLFSNRHQTSIDGRWWSTLCPFHDDHNPSFWIDTRRQLCGCETCQMLPMDVINLYSRQHHVTESIAVVELAKQAGIWG